MYVQIGSQFSYQITATNNPTSYGIVRSPEELVVDESTGLVTGVITTDIGLDGIGLRAYNEYGTGSGVVYIQMTTQDPSVILPPDTLDATDKRYINGLGWSFILGWNYPPYTGDITVIEIYQDDVKVQTLSNSVGGSQTTGRRVGGLTAGVEYSFKVKFGDSEGNFSALSGRTTSYSSLIMENKHLNEALNEAGKLIKSKLRVAASEDGFKASGRLDKSFDYSVVANELQVKAEKYAGALSEGISTGGRGKQRGV